MTYAPKYLTILALSTVTALAVGVGINAESEETDNASANVTASALVISQVYGGGGNSQAPYTNDFVELFSTAATNRCPSKARRSNTPLPRTSSTRRARSSCPTTRCSSRSTTI